MLENPILSFETHLKNIQKLLFQEEVSPDNIGKIKGIFTEKLKSYQLLKKEFQKMEKSKKEIETLVEIGKIINSVLDTNRLLNLIMDMVIKVVGAERGFLMLKDKETGELTFKVARNMDEELKDKAKFTISSGITSRVAKDGKAILSTDAQGDERFQAQASVLDHNLRSILCVPLKVKDDIIGTIFVDNRMVAGAFTQETAELLTSFANQAAISIENARLYENVAQETTIRTNLQRYLSPTIVNEIIDKNEELVLGGNRTECSILFADICSFTSISEKLPPEKIVSLLNEYFTAMTKIIFENEGTLDKFVGDALMAVFGVPIYTPHSAVNAVKTGLDMLKKLGELHKKWESEGNPAFKIRIGINTGVVVAGNIGSPERMDFTVIGDSVNLASRIESNARPFSLLISDSTYEKVKDCVTAKEMEPILVKGKANPVKTYEIINMKTDTTDKAIQENRPARKTVSIFATFKIPPDTKTNQGIIQNISSGGLLLNTRVETAPGKKLLFDFTLDETPLNNIEGKVVHLCTMKDKRSDTYFKLGIEFVNPEGAAHQKIHTFTTT